MVVRTIFTILPGWDSFCENATRRTLSSSAVNLRSLLISFYLLLLIVVVTVSGVSYWRNDQEHQRLLAQEQQVRLRLAEARARLADQERVLDRLRNDPSYVETVIRRRLGYAKPGEIIFRFEDQQ
ncbi:hypothetical protein AW736_19455 [Termitidicoccus mucosus]|uniref:Septum formation initiator n=1 Tax=Termitidicoccus mucosus TaxID=1184151 RepID=A0A178IF76_9BACT|nr:hypothetical protein AW736_19455 [Opitutaceae bacterium TSB47]